MKNLDRIKSLLQVASASLADVAALLEAEREASTVESPWLVALRALEDDKPTGAWGTRTGGIAESRNVAGRIERQWAHNQHADGGFLEYKQRMQTASKETGVPFCLLLAIASRETWHGQLLDSLGWGDHGNAWGLMQIDKRYHTLVGGPCSLEHITQAAQILLGLYDAVANKHRDWMPKYWLKGALVAYNSGVRNVATIERMDAGTYNNDYGADTAARAKYYLETYGA